MIIPISNQAAARGAASSSGDDISGIARPYASTQIAPTTTDGIGLAGISSGMHGWKSGNAWCVPQALQVASNGGMQQEEDPEEAGEERDPWRRRSLKSLMRPPPTCPHIRGVEEKLPSFARRSAVDLSRCLTFNFFFCCACSMVASSALFSG